ncbi:MAG: hypothetical protein AAGU75_08700 [Bacillota bacterium]
METTNQLILLAHLPNEVPRELPLSDFLSQGADILERYVVRDYYRFNKLLQCVLFRYEGKYLVGVEESKYTYVVCTAYKTIQGAKRFISSNYILVEGVETNER